MAPALLLGLAVSAAPRYVRVDGQRFVLSATNETIVMQGPNVVVKGPPYMPSVSGDTICNDVTDGACTSDGTCKTCFTFNEADVAHMKSIGYNSIRLGVVWAGAQTSDEDALDAAFLERLHAVLNLTDRTNIHVVLDNHGDMVGSAGCGNGVPMWVQKKAAPELIGKQLVSAFPYSIAQNVKSVGGYDHCGDNATKWAAYAGDPNYNLLNECCQAMNSGNPGGLGYSTINQKTMEYVMSNGAGRDDFVRFWRLVAEAVVDHPSAFALEPMNEPMYINRVNMFDTWRAIAEAANAVVPDISVAVADIGEEPVLPDWVTKLPIPAISLGKDIIAWMKSQKTLFYAFHGYQLSASDLADKVTEIQADWDMPSYMTEGGGCDLWKTLHDANISHSYWHYSCYCNTRPQYFGPLKVPDETFGGCVLGWGGGNSSKYTDKMCL